MALKNSREQIDAGKQWLREAGIEVKHWRGYVAANKLAYWCEGTPASVLKKLQRHPMFVSGIRMLGEYSVSLSNGDTIEFYTSGKDMTSVTLIHQR